jgi:hypothetical protein
MILVKQFWGYIKPFVSAVVIDNHTTSAGQRDHDKIALSRDGIINASYSHLNNCFFWRTVVSTNTAFGPTVGQLGFAIRAGF